MHPVSFRNPFERTSQATVVAVIPARYASTRLPGKPLADLDGRPMIEHVYRRAAQAAGVDAVLMTTLENDKNFSDGVAYGLKAGRTLLNVVGQGNRSGILHLNASDINMSCYLYDASDSKLLWQTYRKGGTDLPSGVDDLVEYYSSWIAKRFPYKS